MKKSMNARGVSSMITTVSFIAVGVICVVALVFTVTFLVGNVSERITVASSQVEIEIPPSSVQLGPAALHFTVKADAFNNKPIQGFLVILKNRAGQVQQIRIMQALAAGEERLIEISLSDITLNDFNELAVIPLINDEEGNEIEFFPAAEQREIPQRDLNPTYPAVRNLPAVALPGVGIHVTITVQFDSTECGGAVEESIPAGWTVSGITGEGDGSYSAADRTIRWAPIFGPLCGGNSLYTLEYDATPADTLTDESSSFAGVLSIDGGDSPIAGRSLVQLLSLEGASYANGMVAHYSFEGNAQDVSGNNRDGAVVGTIDFSSGGIGQSAFFTDEDGDSEDYDIISVPNAAALQLTRDFTLSFWINPTYHPPWNRPMHILGKAGTGLGEFNLYYERVPGMDGGFVIFKQYGGEEQPVIVMDTDSFVPAQHWSHVVVTVEGNRVRAYVNSGKPQEGMRVGPPQETSNALTFGSYEDGTYFEGRLDEVRLYDRALSEAEIRTLYLIELQNVA